MSTHDELVTLLKQRNPEKGLAFLQATLSRPPDWAPDLPLGADISCAREYSK